MESSQWYHHIPILGGLTDTSFLDHREAFRELVISWLISAAPLWIGLFVLFATENSSNLSFGGCIYSIIKSGELFIYASTTLAPVMYIITRDRSNNKSFPSKYTFMSLVLVFASLSAATLAAGRFMTESLSSHIINISICFYLISIFIFYFALVYNNTYLPNAAEAFKSEEDEYYQSVIKHRG